MKSTVKYAGKLALSAGLSWTKINVISFVSFLITFLIGLLMLISDAYALQGAAHASGSSAFILLILSKPVSSLLLLLLAATPVIILMLGNRYIVRKLLYRITQDKAEEAILPLLKNALEKVQGKYPALFDSEKNILLIRLRLLQELQLSTENKWAYKLIGYLLKKTRLDDIDFTHPEFDLNEVIVSKVGNYIQSIQPPSRNPFIYLYMAQWVLMLLIWHLPV